MSILDNLGEQHKVEQKMKEIISWSDVKYLTDQIEAYIGVMERKQLNTCGDIRYYLIQLEELFQTAEDKAKKLLADEADAESEADDAQN